MNIESIKQHGTWIDVVNAANVTVWREQGEKEPSDNWKWRMLRAEHSPIRELDFSFVIKKMMWWVHTHFARHNNGINHYVSTSRSDRTGVDRKTIGHDSPVNHRMRINAQEILYISRKRLCSMASSETRSTWQMILRELQNIDPVLTSACVPECIYRGYCYEMKSCGYYLTEHFHDELKKYRDKDKF